jgi:serine/threonine protein kinase
MLGVGSVVAGYRIERVLGAGGMGAVYVVANPELPRKDALKVLDAGLSQDPNFRARFIREADIASVLDHPNIVSIYRRGRSEEGQLWIAMQFVEGIDADEALRRGEMTPARAIHIVGEVAKALDYAHERQVIHRDVKPANFLLTGPVGPGERVLLGDFGIARALDDVSLTVTGSLVATIAYAAPEVFAGGPIDGRADLYSLGCTLFRLLTGKTPFSTAGGMAAVMSAHMQAPPPRVTERAPGLPVALDAVIARAMAKNPAHRYPSAEALASDAVSALADRTTLMTAPWQPLPGDAVSTYRMIPGGAAESWSNPTALWAPAPPLPFAPPPARPRPRRRRRALMIAALAAVIALAGATATAVILTHRSDHHADETAKAATTTTVASQTPPGPLPVSALPGLLPSAEEVADIMGAAKLAVETFQLSDDSASVDEKDCVGAFFPDQHTVYDNTGWIGDRVQVFQDLDGAPVHSGSQAIIAFPTAAAARKLVADQTAHWSACSGRTITMHLPNRPLPQHWTFGPLANTDATLSMTHVVDMAGAAGCQHALAARNNIVIDVSACRSEVTNQAVDIVNLVAAKIPQ